MKRPFSSFAFAAAAAAALPALAGVKYWDNPGFKAYDVGDYVQDGLVLHYDGIRNAGAGAEHSTTSDTWVNLAPDGGYNLSRFFWSKTGADSKPWVRNDGSGSGAWNENNGFVFDGKGGFVSTKTLTIKPTYTLQLAMTATAAAQNVTENNGTTGYIFRPNPKTPSGSGTWENCSVCIRNTANGSTTDANAIYTVETARFGNNTTRPQFSNASPKYATVLGTDNALTCFEGTAIPSTGKGYKAGTISTDLTSAWFAIGAQQDQSPRANNGLQAFIGTLHSFRFYSKALSADDLAWNRVIDEYRFFGGRAPIPVTNIVVATSVTGAEGDQPCGAYALDAEGFTFTAPAQRTVEGKRHVLGGYTLETWNGTAWVADGEGTHTGSSVELSDTAAKIRLIWQYAPASGEGQLKTYDVGDYVTGAVIHFDGILNQGVGQPHAAAATTWVNLGSGGATYDLTLKDSSGNVIAATGGDAGTWTDDGFAYVGKSRFNCGTARTWGPDYTIQILADAKRSSLKAKGAANYIFATGWNQCALAYYETSSRGIELHTQGVPSGSSHYGPYLSLATLTYATATLDSENRRATIFTGTEIPTDASLTGVTNYASSIMSYSNGFNVGGWGGGGSTGANFLVGTLKNLRVYDRVLTDAELSQNRKVDEYRFFGRYTEPNVVVQSTYSYLEGYDKSGGYEVDGSYTFVAPESVTAPNGITYAPDGYILETQDANGIWGGAVSHVGSSYLYEPSAGTVRLTWKWKATSGLRTAADYSLDDLSLAGLRLHYDGKLNAGVGVAHSDTATKWVNLGSDGAAMDLSRATASSATAEQIGGWTADGYAFGGYSQFNSERMPWGDTFTAQCLADVEMATNSTVAAELSNGNDVNVFATTWNRMGVRIFSNKTVRLDVQNLAAANRPRFAPGDTLTFFTAIEDAAAKTASIFNGVEAPAGGSAAQGFASLSSIGNVYTNAFRLGGWGGSLNDPDNVIGTIKTFRYYDRVLTEEELVRNRQVDSARYFGELGVTNVLVAVEEGSGIAADPLPGAYFVEGQYTFTATGPAGLGYKVSEPDGNGGWRALDTIGQAASFAYDKSAAEPPPAFVKLEWRLQKPFTLIVR